jgi:hypothetical protein
MITKLEALGIKTNGRKGEIKVLCPWCSHTRNKSNDQEIKAMIHACQLILMTAYIFAITAILAVE